MRRWFSVGLVVLIASVAGMAPSAQASTVRSFHLKYGATYTKGTITFYNRSAKIVGVQRAVSPDISGCRYTAFWANPGGGSITTDNTCNGTHEYSFTIELDQPGGPSSIGIYFHYNLPEQDKTVAQATIKR